MKYTEEDVNRAFDRTGGRCFYCGRQLSLKACGLTAGKWAWDLDNFIPASKTDSGRRDNRVPACVSCGTVKKGLFPWEFDSRRFRQGDECADNYLQSIPIQDAIGGGQP